MKPQADQQTGRAKKDSVKSTDSRENVMSEGEMNILKYTYKDTWHIYFYSMKDREIYRSKLATLQLEINWKLHPQRA